MKTHTRGSDLRGNLGQSSHDTLFCDADSANLNLAVKKLSFCALQLLELVTELKHI